ncbi:hypothetical protein E3N88_11114 [Mikania micrantha]|uniref:Uncharacterized protein n=1 Tax=Mikania micrantha TaxID=192012 RepID=A0A5N6PCT8_9ASTR|nr:hypothetical protein E3N88_11114 [Mikania micrantha]
MSRGNNLTSIDTKSLTKKQGTQCPAKNGQGWGELREVSSLLRGRMRVKTGFTPPGLDQASWANFMGLAKVGKDVNELSTYRVARPIR